MVIIFELKYFFVSHLSEYSILQHSDPNSPYPVRDRITDRVNLTTTTTFNPGVVVIPEVRQSVPPAATVNENDQSMKRRKASSKLIEALREFLSTL